MSANFSIRKDGDVTIVDCTGRISLAGDGSGGLRHQIDDLVRQGKKRVILNLGETSYVDSTGIGELVSAFTRLAISGAQLKLLALTGQPKELLRITKLYTVFETYDDEATAVRSFV